MPHLLTRYIIKALVCASLPYYLNGLKEEKVCVADATNTLIEQNAFKSTI